MKLSKPVLMALWLTALTPILDPEAVAADTDEDILLHAASAPILGRDAAIPDQNRDGLSRTAFASIFGDNATAADRKRDTLLIGSRKAPYYCNRRLTIKNPDVTRAIIVIHGGGRNASEYFDAIMAAMPASTDAARDWRRKTIVLAPHFQEKDDARKDELYWEGDWNRGGEKKDVSSFAVVDALVARLRGGSFPNLKWIVMTGHSAGGQFVQRYAAFTDIDLLPAPNSALVKFVPSNPSSYVYLNEYRFDETRKAWVIPRGKTSKEYDEFKYGLDNLDDYAGNRGPNWARTHLPKRWVEVLAGTADIEADSSFDDSKAAMWQGETRYERALLFNAFMDRFYTPNRFHVTSVPNVGHDHREIYASAEAKRALYFPD